jgi:excisionase family DNA binding protein
VRWGEEPSFLPGLSPGAALRPLPSLPRALLTVAQVADLLGLSKATVYKLCDCGDLAHVRVSNSIRVTRSDLELFLKSGRR